MTFSPKLQFFTSFRRIVFWLHLITGLVAGVVLFIACLTGTLFFVADAMQHAAEEKYSHVAPAAGPRLSPDEILARTRAAFPGKKATHLNIASGKDRAAQVRFGRDSSVFVNPYTGEVRQPEKGRTDAFLKLMLDLHRNLALTGAAQPYGKHMVNVATIVMIFLGISGLWLWWPRRWSWRSLKATTWFIRGAKGRTRDWNWHNVFGFWTLPAMIVLCVSGVVLGYEWATDLTYRLAGDPLPQRKKGRPPPNPAPDFVIAKPGPDAGIVSWDAALAEAAKAYPGWDRVVLQLPPAPNASTSALQPGEMKKSAPLKLTVNGIGRWLPIHDYADIFMNPYTAEILHVQTFEDIPRGGRWKIWLRWLHTGMAFGFAGEVVAALISLTGCVLVWTGFALTYRRFFKKTTPFPG